MNIHFCDLCNESVPEGDFSTGKAFLRKGRVICATCEALMSAEEDRVALAASGQRPVLEPLGPEQAGPARAGSPQTAPPLAAHAHLVRVGQRRSGGGAWIGLVALSVACAVAWVLSGRLNDVRRDQELLRVDLGRGLELASRDLDDFNFRARERVVELERRLGDDLGAQVAEATTTLDQLRKELSRSAGRLAELEQQLGGIVADHQDGLLDAGRRFDDLTARAIRSREELDNLRDRLDEAETTLAQGVPALVAAVADPVAPKWAVELADLASSNAGSRWNAVTALGETGDPGVIPYLTPVLKDQDVFVRMAVARVLGDLGAPEAIEPLIGALEDEEPVVREAAMVSLHAITGRNFHFDPMASTAEREKKIKAWRQWWAKARADYFGDT